MYQKKQLKELTIKNNFLFGAGESVWEKKVLLYL